MERLHKQLQKLASVIMLINECEQMADDGCEPNAITEVLRIACEFYGTKMVCQELNNNTKLLKYLSR